MSLAPGTQLGRHRISDQIGAGGMGEVYRAHDTRLGRDVAIKVLPQGSLADPDSRRSFHREAALLCKLNDPHIETVYDFDSQDGIDFLVLEFIEGTNLDDALAAGPLPEREVARLGVQLAEGLAAAHKRGIVHRDLKPGNLRLTSERQLKILDFGLARLFAPGTDTTLSTAAVPTVSTTTTVAGTLPYMAPEQILGDKQDGRTDIHAAGAVLYEMATGERAFPQTQGPQLMSSILSRPPRPPGEVNPRISPALEAILLKAMEKDPERRYQSAVEMRVDLQRILTPSAAGSRSLRRPLPRRILVAALTFAGLGLVGFGIWRGGSILGLLGPERVEALAVLPLENLSHDPEQEFFVDGMTEQLINDLAQVHALKVISRTSVMGYKNARKPLREIARELGVDAVVEGSVLRGGDRVRIVAQLVHARTDRSLWAQTYDRALQDVLSLQGEVARAIVDEIRVRLSAAEQTHLARARPVDPRALDAYLRGRLLSDRQNEADLRKSIASYEQAIVIDPQFAPAYAGLAQAWWGMSTAVVPASEAMPKARAAAEKALAIDPSLAEAYTALGSVKAFYDWSWREAEADLRRAALELKPSDAEAHMIYGYYLSVVRRFDDAIDMLRRARELDPLSNRAQVLSLHPLYEGRRYEAAIRAAHALLQSNPNHPNILLVLGQANLALGRHTEAIDAFEKATAAEERQSALLHLGCAYAAAGDMPRARAILDQVLRWPDLDTRAYPLALLYAALGDKDQAFHWLELGIDQRSEDVLYIESDALLDGLRPDPRFNALVRRLGFPS